MSTFDHKKSELSQPTKHQEMAKASLPTSDQLNKMSNTLDSLNHTLPNKQEETANEFFSEKDGPSSMSNTITSFEYLMRMHQ